MMAIDFLPSGGGDYNLADAVSSYARNVRVTLSRQAQVQSGLRWANTKVFARGNQQVSVGFQVQRLFPNAACAAGFMLTNLLSSVLIPSAIGNLHFSVTGGTAVSFYSMENACVVQVNSSQIGSSTFHNYQFVGTDVIVTGS